MKKRRSVYLRCRGTAAFPRYIVIDSGGKVWTGRRWDRRQRPLLFADVDEAAKLAQLLLQHEYRDAGRIERYVVPICIEVRSRRGIRPDEVRHWLRQAMSVNVAYGGDLGNGPTDDGLVLLNVDWGQFVRS